MATLVAVGGAALGAATRLGWGAGWLAGSVLGNLLFPAKGPDSRVEGPRLGDLTITSAANGAPVAIGFGTLRMAGNLIWSSGIREKKNVERAEAGKRGGGASQTAVSYSYTASFAIAFGVGPAADVLRLWADGKLILDKTGSRPVTRKPSLRCRLHKGGETQLPDPLIEGDVGVGRAPAHRGLVYLVVEELPLADFGNRIPNLTAEIAFRRTPAQPYRLLDPISPVEGGLVTGSQLNELAVDWRRNKAWLLDSDGDPAEAGLRRLDLASLREDRQARMSEICTGSPANFPNCLLAGGDGALYFTVGSGNSRPIVRVDPDALREVARFGTPSSGLSNTTTRFVATTFMGMVSAYGPEGRVDFLLTGSLFNDLGLLRAAHLGYVWGAGQEVAAGGVRGCVGGRVEQGYGEGWVLASGSGTSHTTLGLYRIRVAATAAYNPATGLTIGVEFEQVASFAPDQIDPAAVAFWDEAKGLVHDPSDDGVVFQVRTTDGAEVQPYTVKWRAGDGLVWATPVPIMLNWDGPFAGQNRLTDGRWTLMRLGRVIQLDAATGELLLDVTWPVSENGAQIHDSETDTHLAHTLSGWARLFLSRGGGAGQSLAELVTSLCARAGLAVADLDTSDLMDDLVPGYVLGRPTTVRGALDPLLRAYAVDVVESDDRLAFRKRGRDPIATIPAEQLMPLDERTSESWRERRTQEVELPERVNVLFMDRDADHQQGSQSAKRRSLPLPTMHSRDQASLELPLVLDTTTARRIAERTLYSAWLERSSFEALLPPDQLRLEPTDVIEVAFPSGAVFRVRLGRVEIGADYSLAIQAVSQEAPSYVATVEGVPGAGGLVQVIAGPAATRLILPDLPLLRDVDDTGGVGSRLYALMAGYGAPGWPGAMLYRSAEGTSWSVVARALAEAAWGAAVNPLGSPRSPFATDEANTLTVFMTTGAERLESTTQAAMLNGANAALLLKASGEPEILQFREVTDNPDGSFTFKGLLRGRRGTDPLVTGHQPGELFVLLEPDTIETLTVGLGELGLARSWRAVGFGSLFEDADTEVRAHTGRDLMPYAPVHLVGSRNPAGDLALTWVRRTRLGGAWRDGTGAVPLGEASEAYEVDILDGPGGGVVRTLTGLTGPAATYTAAQQSADFGAPPAVVHMRVVQLSAAVGRGFPAHASL